MDRPIALFLLAATLAADPELPARWFDDPILPRDEAAGAASRWAEAQARPFRPPADLETWAGRREIAVEDLLRAYGLADAWPPEGPGRVETLETRRGGGLREDWLAVEAWPGFSVPALVQSPDPAPPGKAPGLLRVLGTGERLSDAARERGDDLARRGLVVLTVESDPGFDEEAAAIATYSPRGPATLALLAARRGLDALAARPEVDADRLAVVGPPGPAADLAALDERVGPAAVVVPGPGSGEGLDPPGLGRAGGLAARLALRAPRPTLLVSGEAEGRRASGVFALFGPEAAAKLELSDGPEAAAVDAWLGRDWPDRPAREGEPVEGGPADGPRPAMPEGNRSAGEVAREWAEASPTPPEPREPADVDAYAAAARFGLAARLGFPRNPGLATSESIRRDEQGGIAATFLAVEVEPGLRVPAAEFRPAGVEPKHVQVLVGARSGLRGEVASALAAGEVVVVIEPRGAGELPWDGPDVVRAARSAGRPRVGQEAYDILRIAALWQARPDVRSVAIAADARFGKAALFAAALDPSIQGLAVELPPTERARLDGDGPIPPADVPGLLPLGDLPQFAALVAPRPMVLRVPDPAAYDWTRAAYRAFGAEAAIGPAP